MEKASKTDTDESWFKKTHKVLRKKLIFQLRKFLIKYLISLMLVLAFDLIFDVSLVGLVNVLILFGFAILVYQLITIVWVIYKFLKDDTTNSGVGFAVGVTIVLLIVIGGFLWPWFFERFLKPLNIDFSFGFGLVLQWIFFILIGASFFIFDLYKLIHLFVLYILDLKNADIYSTIEDLQIEELKDSEANDVSK